MNDDEVLALIREALHEVAPDRAESFAALSLEVEVTDLGIDSIRIMEMVGSIEDRLAKTFGEDDLAKVKTLEDLGALIRKECGAV